MIRRITLALLMAVMAGSAFALEMNRFFSDNMVVQRDKPLVIRGTADKGAEVTVAFAGQTKSAKANDDGVWTVILDPMPASAKPEKLTAVSSIGNRKSKIQNILVGDVFLHARQSYIDISLGRDKAGVKAASSIKKNPLLRAISIKAILSAEPLNNLAKDATTGWNVIDKSSALTMTASAYYLGRDLVKQQDVPIGIIDINMGPAFANSWLSREALMETGKFYTGAKGEPDTDVERRVVQYEEKLAAERKGVKLRERDEAPPKNTLQHLLFSYAGYRGTLLPLAGMGIKAVVVQLGNDYPYTVYQELLDSDDPFDGPALDSAYAVTYDLRKWGFRMEDKVVPRVTREWRKVLGEDLPFGLIVPPGSDLNTLGQHHREMRELQRLVTEEDPTIGIILPGTQHIPFSSQPANDELLAKRCLSWINGAVYKKPEMPATGPMFDRIEASFNEATIHFKEGTAKGLKASGDALDAFEVANIEGDYSPVKATIDGETIRLESDTVTRIVRVRYNWNNRPDQGFVNGAGLPAIPFRSERAEYDWLPRNEENDLPEEYSMAANEWPKNDVTLINVALEGTGYGNFTGWIGPAGFKTGPFGPNMGVKEIKEGSPAEGKLLVDDIIYSANGKMVGDKGWLVMGAAVTESETREGKGKLVLGVRRGSKNIDVELSLEVMGTYSPTAPYDCPKTEKIIDNLEKWVVANGAGAGFLNYNTVFMLATGNPELQGYVRRAVYEILENPIPTGEIDGRKAGKSWYNSADAYLLGEYYLATGDKNVLPHLKYACDKLAATQIKPVGGWRHNFPGGASYGMMPNAGLPGIMGMYFAQEAGVEINMECFKLAVHHYTEGRTETGTMIYGSTQCARPPVPFTPSKMASGEMDTYNGGVSSAGILMRFVDNERAAHMCSSISTYSFNNTYVGHGGNFWNNMWTPLGAHQAGKESFIHFWKGHRWYRECSRMFDGQLIGGGNPSAHKGGSAAYGIALVAPRERIQIVGAPPSPFTVNAPTILKPALAAYWKKDYALAEKLAKALINDGSVGVADLPTVEYFVRAAAEIAASIDADLARMQKMIAADDLYGAKSFLAGLRGVMPKGNARLAAMQKTLADVQPPKSKKKETAAPTEKPRDWIVLVRDTQFQKPNQTQRSRGAPWLTSTSDKPNLWKINVVESIEQAPEGWHKPKFDDSNWLETALPKSWCMYHTAILRTRFNVDAKSKYDGLRLHSHVLRQQGVEIYLNGELIGKINSAGKSTNIEKEFKASSLKHLKNGENSLVIKTRHNWRWGHRGMYAYNGGFDFNLDARLKEEK